jgi:hypothetical protein
MLAHCTVPYAQDSAKLEANLTKDGSSLRALATQEETEGGQDRSTGVLFQKS